MVPASAEAIVAATAPLDLVDCEVDIHVPALGVGGWLPRPVATAVKQVRLRKKRRKLETHEKRTKDARRLLNDVDEQRKGGLTLTDSNQKQRWLTCRRLSF